MKIGSKKIKLYVVQLSDDLFGDFLFEDRLSTIIVAEKNELRAAQRAWEKGLGRSEHSSPRDYCEECWASFRVREKSKPDRWSNYAFIT